MESVVAVALESDAPAGRTRAAALGAGLSLPLVDADEQQYPLLLVVTSERLELRAVGPDRTGPVYAEFVAGRLGHRRRTGQSAGKPMLAKAVGFKGRPLSVCDATAGLGRDAFLLACLGCTVTAVERSPVMAALLQDGLDRAAALPELAAVVRERLRLVVGDARNHLACLSRNARPEVVYIDPMFPPKGKTALAKKEMRICRTLVGDDADAAELLRVAVSVARSRVVVKRSLRAPALGGKPAITYKGTTIRYDVYLPPREPGADR